MDALTVSRWIAGIPGMSNADNLASLYDCALRTREVPGALVEIGTWCGRSAVVLGRAAREMGARLFCYDIFPPLEWWRERVSAEVLAREIAPVYGAGGPEKIAHEVLAFHRLLDSVTINNSFYGRVLPTAIRFAFVDGAHDHASVCRDILELLPALSPGAWIVFDDVFTGNYPQVPRAIVDALFHSPRLARIEKLNNKMMAIQVR